MAAGVTNVCQMYAFAAVILLVLLSNIYVEAQGLNASKPALAAYTFGRRLQQPPPIPKPANGTLPTIYGGRCGPKYNATCNGQCCSREGYCGNEEAHCVGPRSGCLKYWGVCGKEYVDPMVVETVPLNRRKKAKDENSTEAGLIGVWCGPSVDRFCPEPWCCSSWKYCGISKEHCDVAAGCQVGWGRCGWPFNGTADGSSSSGNNTGGAGAALSPAQIAGIAASGLTTLCAVTGLIIKLIMKRRQAQGINITVPMSTASSFGTQLSRLSKSSRTSTSSSIASANSVAALLHGVAHNLQQGMLSVQNSSPFARR